ncbi:MAG: hypothetical protein J6T57_02550, partial [Alphaproteobacteria bacterium]|nr:hypothetical protein [Alphaproteobacteria bacterium]
MLADVVEFLPDIQSINPTEQTGFVLWFNTEHQALSVQKQLKVPSVVDSDNDGAHYVIPLKHVDNAMASDFYHRGWSRERNRKFNYYLFTLYNEDSASKIYDVMIAHGYNAILLPNNMQLVVKCLSDSSRDTAIADLKRKLDELDKILPKSMDDYFNKILFN